MFHFRGFLFLLIASLCVEPLPAHALRPQPDRSGVEERLSAAGAEELGKKVQAARTGFLLNQKKDILESSRAYGHAIGRAIQEESERLGNTGGSTVFVMGSFSNGIAVHSERKAASSDLEAFVVAQEKGSDWLLQDDLRNPLRSVGWEINPLIIPRPMKPALFIEQIDTPFGFLTRLIFGRIVVQPDELGRFLENLRGSYNTREYRKAAIARMMPLLFARPLRGASHVDLLEQGFQKALRTPTLRRKFLVEFIVALRRDQSVLREAQDLEAVLRKTQKDLYSALRFLAILSPGSTVTVIRSPLLQDEDPYRSLFQEFSSVRVSGSSVVNEDDLSTIRKVQEAVLAHRVNGQIPLAAGDLGGTLNEFSLVLGKVVKALEKALTDPAAMAGMEEKEKEEQFIRRKIEQRRKRRWQARHKSNTTSWMAQPIPPDPGPFPWTRPAPPPPKPEPKKPVTPGKIFPDGLNPTRWPNRVRASLQELDKRGMAILPVPGGAALLFLRKSPSLHPELLMDLLLLSFDGAYYPIGRLDLKLDLRNFDAVVTGSASAQLLFKKEAQNYINMKSLTRGNVAGFNPFIGSREYPWSGSGMQVWDGVLERLQLNEEEVRNALLFAAVSYLRSYYNAVFWFSVNNRDYANGWLGEFLSGLPGGADEEENLPSVPMNMVLEHLESRLTINSFDPALAGAEEERQLHRIRMGPEEAEILSSV